MKNKKIIALVLCGTMLTACAGKKEAPAVTETSTTTEVTTEVTTEETTAETEAVTETETTAETEIVFDENIHYSYNPHVCPKKLYDAYGPEEWESFFNLCDALRAGEDTFECKSRDAYEWCFSGGPLSKYFPVARYYVTGDFLNGYSDGVGHFTYDIPAEEFVQKQQVFEQLVVDILKDNVRKDYTDFEKCIVLYEYMVENYTYDYVQYANNDLDTLNTLPKDSFGTYRTFRDKTGICDDLSSVYDYLLLQCGVEAIQFDGNDHAWTYVTINDVGYFIDPTWGLHESCWTDLTYFMMSEADRADDFAGHMNPEMFYYEHKNKDVDFSANGDKYEELHNGNFVSLDRENKILYYEDCGEQKEFHYDE